VRRPREFKGSRRAYVGGCASLRYRTIVPLYEYRCTACSKRLTVLTLRVGEHVQPVCDRCGATDLQRLMSRFAMPRSEEARLDALSDPSSLGGLDESDPKSIGKWMRRMGGELGDELGGEDLDEMVDSIESGADPSGGSGSDDGSGGGPGDE